MKLFLRFICFLRGHTPKYFLKNKKSGLIEEVWGVRCSTCGCELKTDYRGTFWE